MEGQCIRREIEGGCDRPGWHAFRSRLDEQAKDIEPIVLSEGGQRRDGICFFHISTNIEIFRRGQEIFQGMLKHFWLALGRSGFAGWALR
jgi:hypothetical protein